MPKSKKENIEEITLDPIEEKVKEPAPVEEPIEEPVEPEAIEEGEDIIEPDAPIEPEFEEPVEEGEQGEDVEFDEEAGEEETDEDAPEEDAPPFLGLMLGAKNAPVSEDPDPQSRIEALLWHIINGTTTDAEPQSRNEAILTAIANSGTYTEEAQSRIEALLIAILNHEEVDITPISRNEAILKAIANSGEYDEEPQSRNEELLLKWLEAWGVVIETASGAIANFTTSVVKPLVNLKAYFEATGGGGTPASPIAISGVSAVSIKHSGSDMTDYDEYIVNLGGTYYGGYIEQDKDGHRQFDDTYSGLVNLSDLTFYPTTKGGHTCFYADLPNGVIKSGGEQAFFGKCSTYTVTSNLNLPNDLSCLFYCSELYGGYTRVLIRDDSASAMTGAQFAAYVTGQIVYEKANPQTVALPDGEPIIAFNGVNNIFNDTNGDTTVEYTKKRND